MVCHDISSFRVTFRPVAYFLVTRLPPDPESHSAFRVTDLPDGWYKVRNSMGTKSCFNFFGGLWIPGIIIDFKICLEDVVVKQSYVIQFCPEYLFNVLVST